jgi:hypothetical protein
MKGYLNSNDKKINFTTYVRILTEGGNNKEDIIKRVKGAKIRFNNKKQLLFLSNLSLEMEK